MGGKKRGVVMMAVLAALAILTESAEDESNLQLPAGAQIADGLKISSKEAQEWVPKVGGQILVSDEVIDQTDEKAWAHEIRTRDSQPQHRRRPGRRRKLHHRTTSPANLDVPFITAGPLEGRFVVDAVMGAATPPEHAPHQAEQEDSGVKQSESSIMRKRVKHRRRGSKRRHKINGENGHEDSNDRKEANDGNTDTAQEIEERITKNVRLGYLARGLVHALSTSAPEYERPWRRRKEWNNKSVTRRPAEDHTADIQGLEKDGSAEEANVDSLKSRDYDGQQWVKFTTETGIINDKSYRRPFSSAKKQHNDADRADQGVSLKEILKKSGSQSLSEVLQNNNLSLSDLLSGKKYAISALRITTVRPEELTSLSDNESTPTIRSFEDEPIKFKTRPSQSDREMNALQPIINKYQWKLAHMLEEQEQILSEQRKENTEKGVTGETTLSQENQDYIKSLETTKKLIEQTEERQSRLTEISALTNPPSKDESLLKLSVNMNPTFQNFFQSEQITDQNSYKGKKEEHSNLDSPQEWINFVDEIKHEASFPTTIKYSQNLINSIISTTNPLETNVTFNELNNIFNTSQSGSAAKFNTSNRLPLKPRLRLPTIKHTPKRILNPDQKKERQWINAPSTTSKQESYYQTTLTSDILEEFQSKGNNDESKVNMSLLNQEKYEISPSNTQNISFDDNKITDFINKESAGDGSITKLKSVAIKDIFDRTDYITTRYKTRPDEKKLDVRIVTAPNLIAPDDVESSQTNTETSGKEELLDILKDSRGGEKLARILAERNMTLKELVEHRERGSSQVHLADIFHNASKEPNPDEPFLSKSSIKPMSKQTYPLRALIDANRHDTTQRLSADSAPFIEFVKQTENNEEHLGIVTLFDKFNSKHIDPKDIKRDSDGSSYFTSVFNIKPSEDEVKELKSKATVKMIPRSDIQVNENMHAWSSDGPLVSEQFAQRITAGPPSPDYPSLQIADVDGDGVIVLDDIRRIQAEGTILHASNQRFNENYDEIESNVFRKLPVSVRSAIIASTSVVGISVVVFLAAFMMCRWRQKRKNILSTRDGLLHSPSLPRPRGTHRRFGQIDRTNRYNCSFNGEQLRSSTLPSRRNMNLNKSSRSISPILDNSFFQSQKVNTLDSQGKRDAQDYLWETIRRPFQ